LLAVVCGTLLAGGAGAADFTWLASPATALWNTGDANWSGAGTVWGNGATNNATFGASSAQAVTADAVTLSNLVFTADGYTVGGGPLLMHGAPTVGAGATATLTAPVTNVGVWAKGGSGTVTLNPAGAVSNMFFALKAAAGTVHVAGGTNLVTQSGSNPESGPAFWVSGGTLVMGGGLLKTTGGSFARVSEYGTLLITNGFVDLSGNGELLNGHNQPGVTTVSGSGVLEVQGLRISQNTYPAAQTVVNINTGGTIRLNNFNLDAGSLRKGTVNFNGGRIVARITNQVDMLGTTSPNWSNIFVNVLAGGAFIDCGANGRVVMRQNMAGSPNDGGLVKLNGGYLYLRGTNSYTGVTQINGGVLNIIRDHNLGAVPGAASTNVLFLASATLQSSESHALAANRTLWITNGVTATFDSQSYTQTVSGTVLCADTNASFVKVGSGAVVLDPGSAALNSFGTLHTTAGTLAVASGTNLVTRGNAGQNAPGLRVSGGTLLVAGGLLKTTARQYVNVDGGHLLITNGIVDTLSCDEILNGIGGNGFGYTTVGGSGVLLARRVRISQNETPATNNVVTLNAGGRLSLEAFYIDTNFPYQRGQVVLNGGTVQARIDTPDFLGTTATLVGNNNDKWLTNITVFVRAGGAVFDTAGKNISIKQPLYTDVAGDGGLVKRGAGTLTLLNTNTYSGATVAEGGTLKFGRDELLPTGNVARAAAGGVLDVNGRTQALAGIGGGGVITNLAALTVTETIEPGDGAGALGTLTLAGLPASMAGCTLAVNVSTNGPADCLHVRGDLDLTTLSLRVEDTAQLSKFKTYTVATCTGTLTAPFAAVEALPSRWTVKYDAAGKKANLVYDFGTLITVR
jgi:autotransporter-associated beta strand protein